MLEGASSCGKITKRIQVPREPLAGRSPGVHTGGCIHRKQGRVGRLRLRYPTAALLGRNSQCPNQEKEDTKTLVRHSGKDEHGRHIFRLTEIPLVEHVGHKCGDSRYSHTMRSPWRAVLEGSDPQTLTQYSDTDRRSSCCILDHTAPTSYKKG